MDLPVPSAVCGSRAAAATVNWPSSAGISKLTWSNADVHGDWKATTYTLIASLVLGSKLLRRGQSHGPARSVKAAGCGRSGTRREHIFLDVVAAAVAAGPSAAAAKGGNPFLLVQDGEEAFRKNRVEESIDLFDSAAESGYPKAPFCNSFRSKVKQGLQHDKHTSVSDASCLCGCFKTLICRSLEVER